MKIHDMLGRKGRDVRTIAPSESVARAIRLLVNHGIGSLVVVEGGAIRGIITERDVLRLVDRSPGSLGTIRVDEVMTRDVILADADDDVHHVMDVMTHNKVRHLPVVEEGGLHGIISIGDVVNELRRDVEEENQHLKDYVQGMVS